MKSTAVINMLVLIAALLSTNQVASAGFVVPIVNGTFESPVLTGNYNSTIAGWTQAGSSGLFLDSAYGLGGHDPDGGTQGAYINQTDAIYQQIGLVQNNVAYTVSFGTATDDANHVDGTTVALYAGMSGPTSLLGSQQFSGTTGVYTPNTWNLNVGVSGFAGQNLYLEFSNTGATGNAFVDGVTATVTPEPSAFILCGLGTFGLLVAARRRKAEFDRLANQAR